MLRARRQKGHEATIHDLHVKIGELTAEREFLSRMLGNSRRERLKMIERDHQSLSVSREYRLLGVSGSTLYYRPHGKSVATLQSLELVWRI